MIRGIHAAGSKWSSRPARATVHSNHKDEFSNNARGNRYNRRFRGDPTVSEGCIMTRESVGSALEPLEQAIPLIQAGDYKMAIKILSAALKKDDQNPSLHYHRGVAQARLGKFFEAIESFDRALANGMHGTELMFQRGVCYSRLFRYEDAIEDFTATLQAQADHLDALFERGLAYKEVSFGQAITDFNDFIAAQPRRAEAYSHRGWCYGKRELFHEAMAEFARAIEIDPASPLAYEYRGALLHQHKEFARAFDDFSMAASLHDEQGNSTEARQLKFLLYQLESAAKRQQQKERFAGTALEVQVQTLANCGIRLLPGVYLEDILSVAPRISYESEPYTRLIGTYSQRDAEGRPHFSGNIWHLDRECIYGGGDYKEIAESLRDLAEGDFPITDIEDSVHMEDQGDQGGSASLSFKLAGKEYKWKTRVNSDWIDEKILSKCAQLLEKGKSGKRFTYLDTGGQDCFIGCATEQQLNDLRERTGLDWQWLN